VAGVDRERRVLLPEKIDETNPILGKGDKM
jgi:hypothetical protein